MAKYFRSSYYYPDDKDIFDFLESTNASPDTILEFLRMQGIYASERDGREHLCDYLSLYYLSWDNAEQLVDQINIRESDEPLTSTDFHWSGGVEQIGEALRAVEQRRAVKERENYVISQTTDGYAVKVAYVDVENGKTRLLQQREKELEMQIVPKADGSYHVRYSDVPRGDAIVASFLGELQELTKKEDGTLEDLQQSRLELTKINSPRGRVAFFRTMMDVVDGLSPRGVRSMRIEHLTGYKTDEDAEDNEDEDDVEDALDRAIFYGGNVWDTPEFQRLVKKGFFPSSATWRAELPGLAREQIEITAGFRNALEGKAFHYKVLGVYRRDDAGDLRSSRERLRQAEQTPILLKVEAAANAALVKVLHDQEAELSKSEDESTAGPGDASGK